MIRFFFIFILLNTSSCSSQTIVFKHVGASDKPITTLTIRNDNLKLTYEESLKSFSGEIWINVNKEDFDFLHDFVINNNTSITNKKLVDYAFGTFKVKFQKNGIEMYYLLPNNISKDYYNKLIVLLKNSNKSYLTTDFEYYIIRRIK